MGRRHAPPPPRPPLTWRWVLVADVLLAGCALVALAASSAAPRAHVAPPVPFPTTVSTSLAATTSTLEAPPPPTTTEAPPPVTRNHEPTAPQPTHVTPDLPQRPTFTPSSEPPPVTTTTTATTETSTTAETTTSGEPDAPTPSEVTDEVPTEVPPAWTDPEPTPPTL